MTGTLHENGCVRLRYCLDAFFLGWEMYRAKVRENQNTHFVFNNFFF